LTIYSEGRTDIIDWKFGQGIFVPVVNNKQLLAYASCTLKHTDEHDHMYHMHIVQPRKDNMGSWMQTKAQLSNWVNDELKPAVLQSRRADAECIPGEEQCRWCVGVRCRARAESVKRIASEIFAPYAKGEKMFKDDFIEVEELTHLLDQANLAKAFIAELSQHMLSKCLTEEGLPGYKAVAGRSFRVWKDEAEAQKYLLGLVLDDTNDIQDEDIFKTKMITVAQAEKLDKEIKKSDSFKALWHKPQGKAVLAPESDPRESIVKTAQQAFAQYAENPVKK